MSRPCRTTSSAVAVAERGAELPGRRARVHPPAVVQLGVHVRVGGALHGRPRRRPELPPIEVPERRMIERAGVPGLKRKPGIPALLVRLQQEAKPVHLEPLTAPLLTVLEPTDPTAHLAEFDLFGASP